MHSLKVQAILDTFDHKLKYTEYVVDTTGVIDHHIFVCENCNTKLAIGVYCNTAKDADLTAIDIGNGWKQVHGKINQDPQIHLPCDQLIVRDVLK